MKKIVNYLFIFCKNAKISSKFLQIQSGMTSPFTVASWRLYQTLVIPASFAPFTSALILSPIQTAFSRQKSGIWSIMYCVYSGAGLSNPIKSDTKTSSAYDHKFAISKRDFCIHAVPFVTIYTLPSLRISVKNCCAPSI